MRHGNRGWQCMLSHAKQDSQGCLGEKKKQHLTAGAQQQHRQPGGLLKSRQVPWSHAGWGYAKGSNRARARMSPAFGACRRTEQPPALCFWGRSWG